MRVRSNKTKRLTRNVLAPIIRRPNAATSKSSHPSTPFWAYSLQPSCKKGTRKIKKRKSHR